MQAFVHLTHLRARLCPLVAGCAVAALGAVACTDSSSNGGTGGGANPAGDPVAGLVNDCGVNVQRDLYTLGLPANGPAGSATSFYDATPDRAVGFYPLALEMSDAIVKFGHQTSSSAGSKDPRCAMIDQTFYFRDLSNLGDLHLDPQRFPEGEAEQRLEIELRFDDVVFPRSLAEVAVALDPTTRAPSVAIAEQTAMPTTMTLDVRYLRPLSNGVSAVVQEQKLPLEFECEAAYPLTVSWQPSSHDSPLCARNDAGTQYCVFYDLRHTAADCRFAVEGQTLTTVDGSQATVDFAGSLAAIHEGATLAGTRLTVDTIHLR